MKIHILILLCRSTTFLLVPTIFNLLVDKKKWCTFHHHRMYYTNLSRLAQNTFLEGMLGLSWLQYDGEKKKEDSFTHKKAMNWKPGQSLILFLVFPLIPSFALLILETCLTAQWNQEVRLSEILNWQAIFLFSPKLNIVPKIVWLSSFSWKNIRW